jgi:hypothetical protein
VEIRYLEGNKLEMDTFVEVALARKVSTLLVLAVQPRCSKSCCETSECWCWECSSFIVRWVQRQQGAVK